MSAETPWEVLRLEGMPASARDIRSAYALALKQVDQAADIAGFERLRLAYEQALVLREGRDKGEATAAARAARGKVGAASVGALVPEPAVVAEGGAAPAPAAPLVPDRAVVAEVVAAPVPLAPPDPDCAARQEVAAARRRVGAALNRFEDAYMAGDASLALAVLLADPDLQDPEAREPLRRALITFVQRHMRGADFGHRHLSPLVTRADLQAIDLRLGWLQDHRALRMDLGGDLQLVEAVLDRAFDRKALERERLRQRSRGEVLRSFWSRLGVWPVVLPLWIAFKVVRTNPGWIQEVPGWIMGPVVVLSLLGMISLWVPWPARLLWAGVRWVWGRLWALGRG